MRKIALMFLAGNVLLLGSLTWADDWTRFRGPNGTGTANDKDLLVKWTDENILFRTPLPGASHSSPIVVKGRLFLLSATDKERYILCYDAQTGKQIWSRTIPGTVGKMINRKSSLASATPCSDGERIYSVFWDGKNVGLYSYDFSGKLLWKQDLGRFTSQHGPGFSPIVHQGKVIVNNDQDGSAVLQAFDAKTGKPVWEVERKAFRACYSTPFLVEQNAGPQLLVTTTAGIAAYDPNTGKEIWHCDWSFPAMPLRTVGSSIVVDGIVFACAGDGSGDRNMIAVKLGDKGDVTRTNLLWQKDRGTPYVPTILGHQGHLYSVLDNGIAVCWEAKTGKQMWQARLTSATISSSPVLNNGKVYVFDEKGEAHVFAASPAKLEVLARNKIGEPIFATPALADGKLYIRGDRHLFCIGKKGE